MKAARVPLGEHAKLIRGITFKPADKCEPETEGAIVCMRTKNVQATLDQSDLIAVPRNLVKNSEKMISNGDILVSSANSWNLVGKCCLVGELQYPSAAGGFISILRPTSEYLDSNYLYRWFSSVEIQRRARSFSNQTTNISNLDHKRTLKLSIPLPPLAEQKRIARILDAADTMRAERRESLAQLNTLLQSTFLDMFGDPVTNPMGWAVDELGAIGEVITGNTPPRSQPENFGNHIEWIKSDNINNPSFFLTEAAEYLSVAGKKIGRTAPEGSILVTCIAGSPSSIGNAAIANREVAFNQQINAFVPDELINYRFAFGLFWIGKRLVQRASTNSMKGMVSKSAFSAVLVPVPPRSLQNRFASIAESVEKQKVSQLAHLDELDTLFASLQSRAFRGDL